MFRLLLPLRFQINTNIVVTTFVCEFFNCNSFTRMVYICEKRGDFNNLQYRCFTLEMSMNKIYRARELGSIYAVYDWSLSLELLLHTVTHETETVITANQFVSSLSYATVTSELNCSVNLFCSPILS